MDEFYNFTWYGKTNAVKEADTPTNKKMVACRKESVDFDNTNNLFIEGDNLDALKLLREQYAGKVKMIYIDPPYNTGNKFLYKDNFNLKGKNLSDGDKRHAGWLNMMYPRLKLARELLRDDGVIFISIDDNEQSNLKNICDEIFEEKNLINMVCLKLKNVSGASGGGQDKKLKKNIEYVLAYSFNYKKMSQINNFFNLIPVNKLIQKYKIENKNWLYTKVLINSGEKKYITSTYDSKGKEIKIFKRIDVVIKNIHQLMTEENITEEQAYIKYYNSVFQTALPQSTIRKRVIKNLTDINQGDVYSVEYKPQAGKNKNTLYEQFYIGKNLRLFAWLKDVCCKQENKIFKKEKQGTYWDLVNKMSNINKEGDTCFLSGKKPVQLIHQMLHVVNATQENDIILDFFAGSATTAHAVIQRNVEENHQCQFIMVQLPEVCDEKSEAFKSGYATIAEISKERIRRAAKQIKEKHPKTKADLGFKVFKLID